MRLPALVLAGGLAIAGCGPGEAESAARKACRAYEVLTDPEHHDEPQPRIRDITEPAAEAAEKDSRFSSLSAAFEAWAATGAQQAELLRRDEITLTAQEKTRLRVLDVEAERHANAIRAGCRKAGG
jgi:hypothetical protein